MRGLVQFCTGLAMVIIAAVLVLLEALHYYNLFTEIFPERLASMITPQFDLVIFAVGFLLIAAGWFERRANSRRASETAHASVLEPPSSSPSIPNAPVKPPHNVHCVGFKLFSDDPFNVATLIFRNVPNGNLLGKFKAPRLRVIFYDHLTGQEIADMCPLQWWNTNEEFGPSEIDASEHYAAVASFFILDGKGKWTAYEVNEAREDDPHPRHELNSAELPTGKMRIVAMLSSQYGTVSIAPITGILTLGKDGSASFVQE